MKIQHITIWTQDIEKSIKFYTEIIGLQIQADLRKFMPADHQVVFLSETAGDVKIELIGGSSEKYSGKGLSIGFTADNLQEVLKKVTDAGIKASEIVSPKPGTQFFFIEDPNGVVIQFVEEN